MQKSSVDGTLVVPLATKGLEHQIQNPKKRGRRSYRLQTKMMKSIEKVKTLADKPSNHLFKAYGFLRG